MPWPSSGQLSPQGSQWAPLCSPKGYFMFSWKVCRAVFTRESRLYLRLCDCHHGPPAAVYRKHGDRRSAGDAKPYPRQFRFIDAALERGSAGKYHRHGYCGPAFEYMPIFDEPTRDAFVKIGMDVMKNTPVEMFSNAIISGWIIATMVWMFPSAGSAKIVVIILMTG